MKAEQIFEQAIARQEQLIEETACRFDDETQEDFEAKIARRLAIVCVGLGRARTIPEIGSICPGQDAEWKGFHIERRRVDHLDNIYVSRSKMS